MVTRMAQSNGFVPANNCGFGVIPERPGFL